jgi:hypothetical protein
MLCNQSGDFLGMCCNHEMRSPLDAGETRSAYALAEKRAERLHRRVALRAGRQEHGNFDSA